MTSEKWLLSKPARAIYTVLAILIMLAMLWEDAGMVGVIAIACIVLLPVLAIWALTYGHRQNLKRRATKL